MRYYIVEHPTRGLFYDRVLEPGVGVKWKYRFAWSITRNDERVQFFWNLERAKAVAAAVKGAYVLSVSSRRTLGGRIERTYTKVETVT